MHKIVLDTNVIISGMIMDHNAPFEILKAFEKGKLALIVSEPILEEVNRVLNYPRIKEKRHLSQQKIHRIMKALKTYGVITPAKLKIDAVPQDPEDNKFICAAIEGKAEYIVSGDRHLTELVSYHGIRIVSPSEFVQIAELD